MLASILLNDEAVGCVLFRGAPKRNLVKSADARLKGKLNNLFNKPIEALSFEDDGQHHGGVVEELAPGTPEHFVELARVVHARSPYTVELVGASDAD